MSSNSSRPGPSKGRCPRSSRHSGGRPRARRPRCGTRPSPGPRPGGRRPGPPARTPRHPRTHARRRPDRSARGLRAQAADHAQASFPQPRRYGLGRLGSSVTTGMVGLRGATRRFLPARSSHVGAHRTSDMGRTPPAARDLRPYRTGPDWASLRSVRMQRSPGRRGPMTRPTTSATKHRGPVSRIARGWRLLPRPHRRTRPPRRPPDPSSGRSGRKWRRASGGAPLL